MQELGGEIWATIGYVFGNMNRFDAILAVIVIGLAGYHTSSLRQILGHTGFALLFYVLGAYAWALTQGMAFDTALEQLWFDTDAVTLRTFLIYFVTFAVAILIIFTGKTAFASRR